MTYQAPAVTEQESLYIKRSLELMLSQAQNELRRLQKLKNRKFVEEQVCELQTDQISALIAKMMIWG